MLYRLRQRSKDEGGFTLIELLVVILIIGILAAIAIPSFLNQKSKANDASAKVQARTAETAAETYSTDHNGVYTGMEIKELQAIEPTLNEVSSAETVCRRCRRIVLHRHLGIRGDEKQIHDRTYCERRNRAHLHDGKDRCAALPEANGRSGALELNRELARAVNGEAAIGRLPAFSTRTANRPGKSGATWSHLPRGFQSCTDFNTEQHRRAASR